MFIFVSGRLGNQMSSLATMYSFARKYSLHPVVTDEQFGQLEFYFEIKNLPLTVLERDLRQFYVNIFGSQLLLMSFFHIFCFIPQLMFKILSVTNVYNNKLTLVSLIPT